MELSQLHIITVSDGEGTNCLDRALAAMAFLPHHRAVIGSLVIQRCRCLRADRIAAWSKPWGHHIWLIEPDGEHYDPSASNLAHWARTQEMELPKPLEQLSVGVIESKGEQGRLVGQITTGASTPATLPDVIYLPGLVYSTDTEEMPSSPAYVTAWGRLAHESVSAGGWDAAQLEEGISRVEELMAGPPRIRSTAVQLRQSKRPQRSGRGFGQEVA